MIYIFNSQRARLQIENSTEIMACISNNIPIKRSSVITHLHNNFHGCFNLMLGNGWKKIHPIEYGIAYSFQLVSL